MRVSCIQVGIDERRPKEATVQHALSLLDRARGSDLILLPELWPSGCYSYARYAPDSELLDGPTVTALRSKARELNTHIFTGSFVERTADGLWTTALLLDPRGDILASYRKIHLFGYKCEEKTLLKAGKETTVVQAPWGPTGLAICYDLRFPELFRRMVDRGAGFFLVPAGWPKQRLAAWLLFNRARAHENLAYVCACNCAGVNDGQRYAGHSVVVSPLGEILAEGGDAEEIVSADIDADLVATMRRDFPVLNDRVPL
jgi:predicted amidohydrolase